MIVTADHETEGLAITMGKTKGYEIVAGFNTGGYSATMVPVLAMESFQNFFVGIYDNTQIFHKMIEALGVD